MSKDFSVKCQEKGFAYFVGFRDGDVVCSEGCLDRIFTTEELGIGIEDMAWYSSGKAMQIVFLANAFLLLAPFTFMLEGKDKKKKGVKKGG